ncbi:MAG: hypothetical protein Q8S33_35765 [Myxococcales bacterium]|nr:hypothetical protein [Myxococcales bacterium]
MTRAELDGPDGIWLDAELLEAAGFLEHEKIELLDVTNGSRSRRRCVELRAAREKWPPAAPSPSSSGPATW